MGDKMKIMFASDIHGSEYYAQILKEKFNEEKAELLVLLGDYLYHGPRNDLPKDYAPKKVIEILNSMKDYIFCIKGNCDSDVDQMVLDFPVLQESAVLLLDGKRVYLSHGHKQNPENPMPMQKGDIFINGHTHVWKIEDFENFLYINPGSITLPKEGQDNSYMVYENKTFVIKSIDGKILAKKNI